MSKLLEKVKDKIDTKLAEKPAEEPEEKEEDPDQPEVWTPFAKKIYVDIRLYKAKLGDGQPTRAVATKFRDDINDKLEKGKEKKNLIDYYNTQFKLPGVSQHAWNYFAESITDPDNENKKSQKLKEGIAEIINKRASISIINAQSITDDILDYIKKFDKKESNMEALQTVNLKNINKHIKEKYPKLDISMVKGKGYFYFDGDDGFDNLESIYVYSLGQLGWNDWIERIESRIQKYIKDKNRK